MEHKENGTVPSQPAERAKGGGICGGRIFTDLFRGPEREENARSLYCALWGIQDTDAQKMVPLDGVSRCIAGDREQGTAFLFHGRMCVILQEGTLAPYLPMLGLRYYAEYFKGLYGNFHNSSEDAFGHGMEIPAPWTAVLYNGEQDQPDRQVLYFTDGPEDMGDAKCVWTAYVYNVNKGRSPEILERCQTLSDFAELIWTVREYRKREPDDVRAVQGAVDACIQQGVLGAYLEQNRSFVLSELFTECGRASA